MAPSDRIETGIPALDVIVSRGIPPGELFILHGAPRLPRPVRADVAAHAFWALWLADDEELSARERDVWAARARTCLRFLGV